MTRVLLDACVLYPSVLREILMACADDGRFTPLWSDRILEEWRRAGQKNGVGPQAEIEIALLKGKWRDSSVDISDVDLEALFLPDVDDRHVLAAAIAGQADELLTANTSDFPLRALGAHGVVRRHPDEFLLEMAQCDPNWMHDALSAVLAAAQEMSDSPINARKVLQKTGLPRVGKWYVAAD